MEVEGASGRAQTWQQVPPALAQGNQEHLLSSASEPTPAGCLRGNRGVDAVIKKQKVPLCPNGALLSPLPSSSLMAISLLKHEASKV